jgi:putative flippase GtrA
MSTTASLPPRVAEHKRLALFVIVGTVNTAICYALFALLVHAFGWHYNLALVADYAFGTLLGYVLHRLSTFADRKPLRRAFRKYTLALVVAFIVNLLLLDALVAHAWLNPLVAQALAMSVATLASYVLQKHWVFRAHGKTAAS